jgi:hypothetical protein
MEFDKLSGKLLALMFEWRDDKLIEMHRKPETSERPIVYGVWQGVVVDSQFNPGPLTTQAASLQILDFTSDGDVRGALARNADLQQRNAIQRLL